MPHVTFLPSGLSVAIDAGGTLLEAARLAGLPLASSCRGAGVCDGCRVRVVEGGDRLSTPTKREQLARLAPDERLACQARVAGAVVVTAAYW